MVWSQFLKNKGCKGKKILDRVRIFSLKNGTKTELLPFCQFFFFGIKIDKNGARISLPHQKGTDARENFGQQNK
jgi:hypothetical protein